MSHVFPFSFYPYLLNKCGKPASRADQTGLEIAILPDLNPNLPEAPEHHRGRPNVIFFLLICVFLRILLIMASLYDLPILFTQTNDHKMQKLTIQLHCEHAAWPNSVVCLRLAIEGGPDNLRFPLAGPDDIFIAPVMWIQYF